MWWGGGEGENRHVCKESVEKPEGEDDIVDLSTDGRILLK
jgi:hypothetical protein